MPKKVTVTKMVSQTPKKKVPESKARDKSTSSKKDRDDRETIMEAEKGLPKVMVSKTSSYKKSQKSSKQS